MRQSGDQDDVDGGAAEDAEHSVAPPQVQAHGVLHVTSHITMKKIKTGG